MIQTPFTKTLLSSLIGSIAFGGYAFAQDEVEEVIVTGIRGSLERSIDVKRNSNSIIDAISAEDIGKLPDITIADSLQRVSGIQIRRSAGEGSTVNVRGLPQVSTQLNGEQFISTGSITTLQPDFADIPAELLSGVEVAKSAEAKTLFSGVAGTINLKTRRPLDLNSGWTFAGSAEASDGSYTEDTGSKFAGFAGFNNGDLGATLTVSKSDAELADYRYGMYNDWWFRSYHEDGNTNWPGWTPAADQTGDGDTNDALFGTIDYGVTNRLTERDRLSVAASFQFKPTDDIELIADVFHTQMDQYTRTNGVVADNAWGQWDWLEQLNPINRGASYEGHTTEDLYTATKFNLMAPRVTAKAESQATTRESTNLNLQANFQVNDIFKASVRYVHGEATNEQTGNFADAFITSGQQHNLVSTINGVQTPVNPGGEYDTNNANGRILVQADMSGTYPAFVYPSGFGDDIDNYALVSTFSEHNRDDKSTLDALRFDGSFEFDNGSFDFGYRMANQDVKARTYDLAAPFTRPNADGDDETAYAKWKDTGISISNGGDTIGRLLKFSELDDMGYIYKVSDFGPADTGGQSYYFINPEVMDNAKKFQDSLYPGNIEVTNWIRSYQVEQESHTLYAQLNLQGELGIPYQMNFGMQAVQNLYDITNYTADPTGLVTVDGQEMLAISGTPGAKKSTQVTSRHTVDFLPRFNIGLDVTEDQKVRFSYSKTMTQMDANNLGLGLSLTTNYDENLRAFRVVSGSSDGSPLLEPWRSENMDLTYEWYFNDLSLLSAGIYYLDIESAIGKTSSKVYDIPDSDGVVRANNGAGIDITRLTNVPGSSIQGFEVSYQQAYEFLPGFLSGLGSTINYTYSESESVDKDFYGNSLPMADNSEDQVNMILWYQKDAWQARLAYNYRSERYIGKPWNDGHPMAWWSAPTTYVDMSVSYDINENFTVYLQGQNITEEHEETYMQWSDVMVNQNVYEARYTLGVRAKF